MYLVETYINPKEDEDDSPSIFKVTDKGLILIYDANRPLHTPITIPWYDIRNWSKDYPELEYNIITEGEYFLLML